MSTALPSATLTGQHLWLAQSPLCAKKDREKDGKKPSGLQNQDHEVSTSQLLQRMTFFQGQDPSKYSSSHHCFQSSLFTGLPQAFLQTSAQFSWLMSPQTRKRAYLVM